MCGLVAVFSREPIRFSDMKAMNDSIAHRGPDDEGYLFSGPYEDDVSLKKVIFQEGDDVNYAFAHRRLSILDLSSLGHQPMSYGNRYWITYNGEIYNHLELRKELETLGYVFCSHTDTEVILAAYDHWGVECQNKFNGMWAFIIHDKREDLFFISRDRFGIKPLYYYQDNKVLIFASEIKALMQHPGVVTSPNIAYCKEFLKKGTLEFKVETAFNNIYRFNFSSYASIKSQDLFKDFVTTKFWDFDYNTSQEDFSQDKANQIAEQYYILLQDSVRLRLRADVPFGSALSGGLDSAAIVYLIEQELQNTHSDYKQQTFSTVHSGKNSDCDESYYIKLITDMLNIKSNTIEPTSSDVPELHKKVMWHWECPMDGTGMAGMSTYTLINKSNVVVTLDGQGADEQQAGYLPYIINYLYNLPFKKVFNEANAFQSIPQTSRLIKVGLALNIIRHLTGRSLLKLLLKLAPVRDLSEEILPLNEKLKLDTNKALINLIHYSDSRSMYYSIESRMPFMDYRLVEFTAQIPAVYKIHNGWTKYFARLAFDKKLPNEICWRKDKMGWPMPDKQWFSGPLNDWLCSTVSKSNFVQNYFIKIDLRKKLNQFGIRKSIRLLNLSVWHYLFFGNRDK